MRARQDAYHVDCFACAVCGVRLVPGDRFAVVDGRLVCETDYPKVCTLRGVDDHQHHQAAASSNIRCTSSAGLVDT